MGKKSAKLGMFSQFFASSDHNLLSKYPGSRSVIERNRSPRFGSSGWMSLHRQNVSLQSLLLCIIKNVCLECFLRDTDTGTIMGVLCNGKNN